MGFIGFFSNSANSSSKQ